MKYKDKLMKKQIEFSDYNTDQELFEGINPTFLTKQKTQNGRKLYNYLIEAAKRADMKGEPIDSEIDEGLLGGLIGGAAGATLGPVVMRAICRILGISEDGTLGKLMTSSMVCAALGAELGL